MILRRILLLLVLVDAAACSLAYAQPAPAAKTASTPPSLPWWRTAVFYEIFVRSFYDTNNDGVGDFRGITQKLDYLEDLGINAIWLMPIHPSPSYHGYDVLNYYNVNYQYGSLADFQDLLQQAHLRDIHVILDLVLNHTSNQHPWFKEALRNPGSKYHDYYLWSEIDRGNGWHAAEHGYYYGLFWEGMPDLNYLHPEVTTDMLKITDFWLDEIGVDGFRIDAAKHLIEEGDRVENTPLTHAWFKGFYTACKTSNPSAYTVGEVFGAGSSVVKSYTGDQLDQVFNFEMASGFVNSTRGEAVSGIRSAYLLALQAMPDFNFATFLANHDQNRLMSVFNGDLEKAKMAAFLLLTSPGTPFLYYGEEIGMSGVKPDEDIRLPMQWGSGPNAGFSSSTPWRTPAPDAQLVSVEQQTGDPDSLLEHYRTLIRIRSTHPALTSGTVTLLDTGHPAVFALIRRTDQETLLIIANLGRQPVMDYGFRIDEAPFSVTVLFGAGEIPGQARRMDERVEYHPLEALDPYSMHILQIIPN